MKRPFRILLSLTAATFAAGASAKLTIMTTTPDLASIAMAVGGSNVSVSSIVVGARDPHRIEAKPSFMSKAAGANLFLAIGLELEIAYEQPILEGSRNRNIRVGAPGHVYVSDWVKVRDVPAGTVTRAQGDVHPDGNPHLWLDPYNGRVIALKLAEKMGALDKPSAAAYSANAKAFVKRLDEAMFGETLVEKFGGQVLWNWDNDDLLESNLKSKGAIGQLGGWAGKMLKFRGKPIVTYHRSWVYFVGRFNLRVVDELEPKPGIEPTPGHVAHVIQTVQQQGVKAILQEPFYSPRNGQFVASRTGASLVVAPGMVTSDPAAKDYISLFDTIVSRLAAALDK